MSAKIVIEQLGSQWTRTTGGSWAAYVTTGSESVRLIVNSANIIALFVNDGAEVFVHFQDGVNFDNSPPHLSPQQFYDKLSEISSSANATVSAFTDQIEQILTAVGVNARKPHPYWEIDGPLAGFQYVTELRVGKDHETVGVFVNLDQQIDLVLMLKVYNGSSYVFKTVKPNQAGIAAKFILKTTGATID